jgi:hypothetical protein
MKGNVWDLDKLASVSGEPAIAPWNARPNGTIRPKESSAAQDLLSDRGG